LFLQHNVRETPGKLQKKKISINEMKTSVSLNPKNSVSAFGNSYCHIKRIDLEIVIGSGNM